MIQPYCKEVDSIHCISFFDYWHYDDVDTIAGIPSKMIAEKINEKIRMQEIYKEFPEHFTQLLPLLS